MFGLKVVVADKDEGQRAAIKDMLIHAGAVIVGEAEDGRKAARLIFELQPEITILDTNLPVRDGIELAHIINEHKICPVILVTSNFSWDVLESAKSANVYDLLLKPVSANSLLIAVELAVNLYSKYLEIRKLSLELKTELEGRKKIEKAKGLLMRVKNIEEEEAYQIMRKLSMDKSKSMVEIAKQIIKLLDQKK